MNKLTVVMPFLNEGDEVEHTVQNIRQTAGDNVDILLINDASPDISLLLLLPIRNFFPSYKLTLFFIVGTN
jgi:glycosyltransferase involved in cell wall biosynthesis